MRNYFVIGPLPKEMLFEIFSIFSSGAILSSGAEPFKQFW